MMPASTFSGHIILPKRESTISRRQAKIFSDCSTTQKKPGSGLSPVQDRTAMPRQTLVGLPFGDQMEVWVP